ncbi:reverse transcriptase domain-containing protein [Clostridium sp.]|uniref:reverse transcriptase domain-containing protein n=1 Tax=Clostridium sp. TaxID=1506 RepID=UPI002FDCB415
MLKQCHRELDGNKAVGINKVTKAEYEVNLEGNISNLLKRLKNKSYKPLPSLRVFIPKGNGKRCPLGIASYEDKIVQLAVKKILEAIYEPRFLRNMYGFRPRRGCHDAIKEIHNRMYSGKISYVVDADIKGFFDHMNYDWSRKYLKAGVITDGVFQESVDGSALGNTINGILNYSQKSWLNLFLLLKY